MPDRNGILILYKDTDWTSFDAVAKARGILSTRKVGHAGTLDPLATGVLPLFLGRATKAINMQIVKDKEYVATFKMGVRTDSGDILGTVLEQKDVAVGRNELLAEMENFRGEITQYPPMFSAVKVNGQPLYKLARQGVVIDRKPRTAIIKELELVDDDSLPENEYKVRVLCSEGTYIRTLIDDMGEKLGCGAVMTSLCRTSACGYKLDEAVSIQQLQEARNNGTIDELVRPTDSVFRHLPEFSLSPELAKRLVNGAKSRISKPDGDYRVYFRGKFYAVVNVTDKKMGVVKLFVEADKEKDNFDA